MKPRQQLIVALVALLAEGVDRNSRGVDEVVLSVVALLAEGVDRNWITGAEPRSPGQVALLAEGVDRNLQDAVEAKKKLRRPPRGGRG